MHIGFAFFFQALSDAKDEVISHCSFSGTPETWQPLDLENDPPKLAGMSIHVLVYMYSVILVSF